MARALQQMLQADGTVSKTSGYLSCQHVDLAQTFALHMLSPWELCIVQGPSEGVRQGVRRCALRCINTCATASPQLTAALQQAGIPATLQVCCVHGCSDRARLCFRHDDGALRPVQNQCCVAARRCQQMGTSNPQSCSSWHRRQLGNWARLPRSQPRKADETLCRMSPQRGWQPVGRRTAQQQEEMQFHGGATCMQCALHSL
jgi:hypothetical protein